MAKIINILGNEKIKVKDAHISYREYSNIEEGKWKNKVHLSGVLFLENRMRINIDNSQITLHIGNSRGNISKHSPAYNQIRRMFLIARKKYRRYGILNNGVFKTKRSGNIHKKPINHHLKTA